MGEGSEDDVSFEPGVVGDGTQVKGMSTSRKI